MSRLQQTEGLTDIQEEILKTVRAFVESDVAWYDEHLSAAFTCSLADGRRIRKAEFLERVAAGPGVTEVTYDEVDVRPLGEVALVHGVTHYVRGGSPASTRYTDVWRYQPGRWLAIAAQLTAVV